LVAKLKKTYLLNPWRKNPLHLAIVQKKYQEVALLKNQSDLFDQKDIFNLSTSDLLVHMGFSVKKSVVPVEKQGEIIAKTAEDYYNIFGVRYVSHLEFCDHKALKWVLKSCKKALQKKIIVTQQKWLGAFYHKEIEEGTIPNLIIRWIDSYIGYGVFAKSDLAPKTFIGEYSGLLRKRKKRVDQKNSYTFEYLIGETLDTPFTIDAKDQGNHCRFVNHDFEGNCDPMLIYQNGIMRVIVYTNRLVKKGEQITYDYGSEYWMKRDEPQTLET